MVVFEHEIEIETARQTERGSTCARQQDLQLVEFDRAFERNENQKLLVRICSNNNQ